MINASSRFLSLDGDGLLNWPARSAYPMAQPFLGYAAHFRQFFKGVFFAVQKVISGCSAILSLFFTCRPLAVIWGVVTIVVDALYREHLGWAFTHVLNETQKGMNASLAHHPAMANGNASTSVPIVMRGVRVSTAINHARPTVICRAWFSIGGVPMFHAYFLFNILMVRLYMSISGEVK